MAKIQKSQLKTNLLEENGKRKKDLAKPKTKDVHHTTVTGVKLGKIKKRKQMTKQKKKEIPRRDLKPSDNETTKDVPPPPAVRKGDDLPAAVMTGKWSNKQRVLVFCSRGVSYRDRHLMLDLRTLLPHSKPDSKMDKRETLHAINEICEMKNCNKCIYLEARKRKDLYMWVANTPGGPSGKFLVENVHTMTELRLTGNCLRGSRALLSFDEMFDKHPHWKLVKELFIQIFGTPLYHPKSQPFFDHVFTFTVLDNRIWFRNYQIIEEDGSLSEIGPRFLLNPIRIFAGSFGGPTLYENPHYISPNLKRRQIRLARSGKYMERVESRRGLEERNDTLTQVLPVDKTEDVFDNVD